MSWDAYELLVKNKDKKKGDVIDWSVLSTRDPFVFEIRIMQGITIILIDSYGECVFAVHNHLHNEFFVKRFINIPHLLGYLETRCLRDNGYVLTISKDHEVYINRRDLIDVLVKCMVKMPHYASPYYSKDEVEQPERP